MSRVAAPNPGLRTPERPRRVVLAPSPPKLNGCSRRSAAGPRALAERDRQLERFAGLLRQTAERARTVLPDLPPVRDLDVHAAAVMANELVAARVRAGRAEQLDELLPDLRYLMLRLLVSDEIAHRVASSA